MNLPSSFTANTKVLPICMMIGVGIGYHLPAAQTSEAFSAFLAAVGGAALVAFRSGPQSINSNPVVETKGE